MDVAKKEYRDGKMEAQISGARMEEGKIEGMSASDWGSGVGYS